MAGSGVDGYSGDGKLATLANIKTPDMLAVDSAGSLFFSDGGRIRKVDAKSGI